MLTITSRRSREDLSWKELQIKFALFPRILENGKIAWLTTYQELYYVYGYKRRSWENDMEYKYVLLRRNKVLSNSIEEFKELNAKDIKKTLDALE